MRESEDRENHDLFLLLRSLKFRITWVETISPILFLVRSRDERRGAEESLSTPPARKISGGGCRGTFEERKQIGIDLVRVSGGHAVRKAVINLQSRFLQELCGQRTGSCDGNNLIVIAVLHQYGDIDPLQVLGQIGL